ncbi:MAG: nitrous oxide reductase accessory protein NosL [Magnetospirillum sp.]|nr:nitrous oxide reductase accessory protein NosL [Magnetospirillum sp.]
MSRRRFVALVPGMVLAVSACGQSASGPAEIKWGRETCDYCGMIIDDPRFAAQVRGGPKGKVFKFDDLGDAVLFLAKQSWADDPATEFWVGSMESEKWLDGRKAFYVDGQHTPMAHGYGAVAGARAGAVEYAAMKNAVLAKGSTSRCEPSETPSTAQASDG